MANTFGKVSGTYQEADQVYAKVSGTWEEMDEVYAKDSGTWRLVFSAFEATSFATLSSGSGSFVVPDQANAIHIQFADIALFCQMRSPFMSELCGKICR